MYGESIKQNLAQTIPFCNEGYLLSRLSDEQLNPILKVVDDIQKDFSKALTYNESLAGNIKKEFLVTEELHTHLYNVVMPLVTIIEHQYHYIKHIDILDKPCPLMVHSAWINFQEKYEFNPLHNHSGVMSFVMWLKVPYSMEDELNNPSSINAKMKCPAHFSFVHTSAMGEVFQQLIPVDKTYEGVVCVFPSKLYHQVYPFYTSDGYRVSLSGNLCLRTGK